MPTKYKYIAAVLLALMCSAVQIGHAQNKVSGGVVACPSRKVTAPVAFDAIAARYSAKFVGMCLGAIGPGNVITPAYSVTKCYGEKVLGFRPKPTSQTLFGIGSITKTMTATLLALRVSQGSVNLNDQIDTLLPSDYQIPTITLLQLADMESGLTRDPPDPYPNPANEAELYTDLQTCVGAPGCWKGVNRYSYSNFAYGVLGNALANHDSLSWSGDNYFSVMAPLGIFDTRPSGDYDSSDFLSRQTYGYSRAGSSWTVSATTSGPFGGLPAGGLWSTPDDMLIWLGHAMGTLHSDNNVDAALQSTMVCRARWGKPKCSSVQDCGRCTGLAWTEDIDECTGGVRISKSGGFHGFKSWIGFDRKTGRGVFVLFNSGALDETLVGEELLGIVP
jgi:CubicO group peptidase (beta-lactamase class C family)